jgi:predicted phosphodiesterase
MLIGAISDIHYEGEEGLLDNALEKVDGCDALVVAGDISHNLKKYEFVLKKLQRFQGARLAVLGNHDLYVKEGEDSEKKEKQSGPGSGCVVCCGMQ